MTYCLGIITRHGLVMAADSRTNAGVDYISTYQKLFDFSAPGERVLLLAASGNLSITQAVVNALNQDLKLEVGETLHSLPTLFGLAQYVGNKIRQIQEQERPWLEKDRIDYQCTLLLGGQVPGEAPGLYMIYSQGNFIQAMPETPFLQIGETKYGKPILDRTLTYNTPLEEAAKCGLLSIDSTMRSNISVGPPIDLVMYESNSFVLRHQLRLRVGDPYLVKMRQLWEISLRQAFERMPNLEWEQLQE
ncbi:proteasome-type protease [Phormidium tenue FACHB-886]|nr:proteasome-type protease [Phormidium tenue FACHB-886]